MFSYLRTQYQSGYAYKSFREKYKRFREVPLVWSKIVIEVDFTVFVEALFEIWHWPLIVSGSFVGIMIFIYHSFSSRAHCVVPDILTQVLYLQYLNPIHFTVLHIRLQTRNMTKQSRIKTCSPRFASLRPHRAAKTRINCWQHLRALSSSLNGSGIMKAVEWQRDYRLRALRLHWVRSGKGGGATA